MLIPSRMPQHATLPATWESYDCVRPLASSFERVILKLNGGSRPGAAQTYPYDNRYDRHGRRIWADGFYQQVRDGYLNDFKRAAAGLRGPHPASLDTDQWWALGRHHGLITPLLDWTESPYIAAFFALSELLAEIREPSGVISFSGRKVAIYRLFHNQELEGNDLRISRPIVDELGRMHGQRGLFTWLDSERFFELQGFMENTGRDGLLTQIIISDQGVMDGLRDLKSHGIDYRLLFPDLHGAAQQSNILPWPF
jgi:hypothetical protein